MNGAFLTQAWRSLESARLLLENGDPAGAPDRAYYAAFDAARAALTGQQIDARAIRTHHGLWSLFAQHVTAAGLVPADVARSARQLETLRLASVYDLSETSPEKVDAALSAAERFVAACAALVEGRAP
jgi:uncharacterized protein (UPF0332 family)